jgi:hypothetical protein
MLVSCIARMEGMKMLSRYIQFDPIWSKLNQISTHLIQLDPNWSKSYNIQIINIYYLQVLFSYEKCNNNSNVVSTIPILLDYGSRPDRCDQIKCVWCFTYVCLSASFNNSVLLILHVIVGQIRDFLIDGQCISTFFFETF